MKRHRPPNKSRGLKREAWGRCGWQAKMRYLIPLLMYTRRWGIK